MSLASVFDIEADRGKIRLVHPGVHGEAQSAAARRERVRQAREAAISVIVGTFPEEPDVIPPRVKGTDDIVCAVIGDCGAWLRVLSTSRCVAKPNQSGPEKGKTEKAGNSKPNRERRLSNHERASG